jgi:hypothetical protein
VSTAQLGFELGISYLFTIRGEILVTNLLDQKKVKFNGLS